MSDNQEQNNNLPTEGKNTLDLNQMNPDSILGGASTIILISTLKKKIEDDRKKENNQNYVKYLDVIEPLINSFDNNLNEFISKNFKKDEHYFSLSIMNINEIISKIENRKNTLPSNAEKEINNLNNRLRLLTFDVDKANYRDLIFTVNKRLSYYIDRICNDKNLFSDLEELKDELANLMIKQRKSWNSFKNSRNLHNKSYQNNNRYFNQNRNNNRNRSYRTNNRNFKGGRENSNYRTRNMKQEKEDTRINTSDLNHFPALNNEIQKEKPINSWGGSNISWNDIYKDQSEKQ